jgi:hypothetical protein
VAVGVTVDPGMLVVYFRSEGVGAPELQSEGKRTGRAEEERGKRG